MSFELAPFDLDPDYGEGIVSLASLKAHIGILHDDRDEELGFYRDAAVDMVERYCGVRLAPCTGLVWRAESLPDQLRLGVWPVTAITGITYLDSTGTEQAATHGDWRVVTRDTIRLKPGKSLPSGVAAGVEIEFSGGFTDANRPPALVQAVKMFAAHLNQNREAVVTDTISGEIPLGFRHLCGAYRMPVI